MIEIMARIYVQLIDKGMYTIDTLPNIPGLKEAVQAIIDARGGGNTETE